MKKIRKILSGILSAVMLFAAAAPASAAASDTGFTDVDAGVWYADAVQYARENGLMSGTGNNAFAPNDTTNLAMLLSTLHRDAGTPAASGTAPAGVPTGSWYASAVIWADAQNLLQNVNNNFAGAPLTREDMVTVLWRYAGSPAVTGGEAFADNALISSYAAQAVAWSRANNIVAGKPGNRFDPKGGATRAEYAVILQNFMKVKETPAAPQPDAQGKALVVYYSASGTTKGVAEAIAEAANAELFEITPTEPYTSADLDWTDDSSRVTREHEDESLRTVPLTTATVANWDSYDTVFIGYPIWWGIAAWPVDGFVKANDFTGKTVIPFCTSASSGLGQSGKLLAELAGTGDWQEGRRFSGRVSAGDIREWISSLPAPAAQTASAAQASVPAAQGSRSLVVYFSVPETTSAESMTREEDNSVVVINGQVLGNTQYMASVIQETTGADLFRIEPKTPYPTDHSALVALASEEQDANARPEIAARIADFDQYDTVYVGYPIWWSDMPMILYTFFDTYDFTGKTIVPFSTHGGSSFAGTPARIAQLEPGAILLDGLTISRDNIQDARQQIVDWVNGLK